MQNSTLLRPLNSVDDGQSRVPYAFVRACSCYILIFPRDRIRLSVARTTDIPVPQADIRRVLGVPVSECFIKFLLAIYPRPFAQDRRSVPAISEHNCN